MQLCNTIRDIILKTKGRKNENPNCQLADLQKKNIWKNGRKFNTLRNESKFPQPNIATSVQRENKRINQIEFTKKKQMW